MSFRRLLIVLMLPFAFAKAMPIPQYDKMSAEDDANYMTSLLKGAVEGLESHGNKQDSDKLYALFSKGDGIKQFTKNLDVLRDLTNKNAANPNNKQPPYEVEQAFALTLKQNGIIVPLKFLLTINKDFKPSHPLKQ